MSLGGNTSRRREERPDLRWRRGARPHLWKEDTGDAVLIIVLGVAWPGEGMAVTL